MISFCPSPPRLWARWKLKYNLLVWITYGNMWNFHSQDVGLENDPYLGFIYTSFQERATFISHGNIARQAKEFGDIKLAKICGSIAADEKRHEHAYTKVVKKLFDINPDGTMLALEVSLQFIEVLVNVRSLITLDSICVLLWLSSLGQSLFCIF